MPHTEEDEQYLYTVAVPLDTWELVLFRSVLRASFRAAAEACDSHNNVQPVLLQPVRASVWRCAHSLATLLRWTESMIRCHTVGHNGRLFVLFSVCVSQMVSTV